MAARSLLCKGARFAGRHGRTYLLASPLAERCESAAAATVWKSVDANNAGNQFVIKRPSFEDSADDGWPEFWKEMEMQKQFQSSRFIRRMVDTIVPKTDIADDSSAPMMMVLEPFEKSLWTARTRRPFTMKEIKHVMKAVLLGLHEIHEKGLVYCDVKMENVLLNSFDDKTPTSDDEKEPVKVQVKLADLGSVMPPSQGKVTSITYRSPEAYLGKPWGSATDIWSWGIVLFQLIQARLDFDSPGIYDSIVKGGTLDQKADAVLAAMCDDFDLRSVDYFKGCTLPAPRREGNEAETETEHWGDRLIAQGVPQFDVVFLYAVLQPDPTQRMTVTQILETGYLDVY